MITSSTLVVRYAETDQMGVAHHAVYPIWYEVARTDCIKAAGVTYSQMERMGVMTPVTELTCRYLRPARYEDVLTVEVSVLALTPARVVFGYTVRRAGEAAPLNTGTTTHAWVDAATFRPLNLKKKFPGLYARIQQFMEEANDGKEGSPL